MALSEMLNQELSFRSVALPREESAGSPAKSRFLPDTTGFGVTR